MADQPSPAYPPSAAFHALVANGFLHPDGTPTGLAARLREEEPLPDQISPTPRTR